MPITRIGALLTRVCRALLARDMFTDDKRDRSTGLDSIGPAGSVGMRASILDEALSPGHFKFAR